MPAKRKKYYSNFLKEETYPNFARFFKDVLFRPRLSYGCRAFLFAQAVLPVSSDYSDKKLGRKLKVDSHQILRWRREALKNRVNVFFRPLDQAVSR